MFANAASNDGGLLAISGGGWDRFNLRAFPGTVHGVVAGIIELEPGHQPTAIEATVTGPDGVTAVFGALVVEDPTEGNVGGRVPMVVPLAFVARQPGTYIVSIADEAGPLTSLELDARLVISPPFSTYT
jgi:hypothetical protein